MKAKKTLRLLKLPLKSKIIVNLNLFRAEIQKGIRRVSLKKNKRITISQHKILHNKSSHEQIKEDDSKIEEKSEEQISQEKSSKNSGRKPESKKSFPKIPKPSNNSRRVRNVIIFY